MVCTGDAEFGDDSFRRLGEPPEAAGVSSFGGAMHVERIAADDSEFYTTATSFIASTLGSSTSAITERFPLEFSAAAACRIELTG